MPQIDIEKQELDIFKRDVLDVLDASIAQKVKEDAVNLQSQTKNEWLMSDFDEEEKDHWRKGLASLEYFAEHIFSESFVEEPFKFELNWHHRLWCNDIQYHDKVCLIGPRYSLKSTIFGYCNSMWRLAQLIKYGIYVSYSDDLAEKHISNIKQLIGANKYFRNFIDGKPKAESVILYLVGPKHKRVSLVMEAYGLMAFKRGLHPDFCLADDILPDSREKIVTPMELKKIEDRVQGELLNLAKKGGWFGIAGTPQDPNDILYILKKNDQFCWRALPAETNYGVECKVEETGEIHDVLWEVYNKPWLRNQEEAIKHKAYMREFMLEPASLSEMYFTRAQIEALETAHYAYSLSDPPSVPAGHLVVAGLDVGKKRHPSHLCVFDYVGDTFTQLASIWLDGEDYTSQVEDVNDYVDKFGIDSLYWDNTRSELEDRGLNPDICEPITFGSRDSPKVRSKIKMASAFEGVVTKGAIRFLADKRQTDSICSVRNDLSALSSAEGHGDPFFSTMMAIAACAAGKHVRSKTIQDVQSMFDRSKAHVRALDVVKTARWGHNAECEKLRKEAEKRGGSEFQNP